VSAVTNQVTLRNFDVLANVFNVYRYQVCA